MSLKNMVVIGGSGNVGKAVLSALIDRKEEFGTIFCFKKGGVSYFGRAPTIGTEGTPCP